MCLLRRYFSKVITTETGLEKMLPLSYQGVGTKTVLQKADSI